MWYEDPDILIKVICNNNVSDLHIDAPYPSNVKSSCRKS